MKFVLMLGSDPAVPGEAMDEAIMAGCAGWTEEMARRGVVRDATGLQPPAEARTVRVRADDVLVTDGPFAETREQIGGFVVIECADLDEAVRLAATHPWARVGTIEVRPVWQP